MFLQFYFISLLFLNRLRPFIYQNDGLDEYFLEKKFSGHDVTDDVINVIYDVISASKLENAITLLFFNRFGQSIHQNHGIEMNFSKN